MVGIGDRTEVKESDSLLLELKQNKIGGIILFEKNISKTIYQWYCRYWRKIELINS